MCEYCSGEQELLGSWVCGDKGYTSIRIYNDQMLLFELPDVDDYNYQPEEQSASDWMKIKFCPVCGTSL